MMKWMACLTAVMICHAAAMDAEAIRRISQLPHDRKNLIKELEIYPDAREYQVKLSAAQPGHPMREVWAFKGTEKVVGGKYLVSTIRFPKVEEPGIMIVEYDKDSDTFRKWTLLPWGLLVSATGVADFEKRTIAWVSDKENGDPKVTVLSIESHDDQKTVWKETHISDDKVVAVSQGQAVKIK